MFATHLNLLISNNFTKLDRTLHISTSLQHSTKSYKQQTLYKHKCTTLLKTIHKKSTKLYTHIQNCTQFYNTSTQVNTF